MTFTFQLPFSHLPLNPRNGGKGKDKPKATQRMKDGQGKGLHMCKERRTCDGAQQVIQMGQAAG